MAGPVLEGMRLRKIFALPPVGMVFESDWKHAMMDHLMELVAIQIVRMLLTDIAAIILRTCRHFVLLSVEMGFEYLPRHVMTG